MSRVYLDNAATTPISEVALQAFIEQSRQLGNPSSLHTYGRKVRKDVEEAREKLAGLIGCHSSEIIFTGSGTEANNLAIKGAYWHRNQGGKQRNVVVISAFEHHAVLDPARWLEDFEGAEVVEVPVTREGFINLSELRNVVLERHDEIALISIMHSNNEVGTVQPMDDISKIAQEFKIPLHTDAVQSLGKVPLSFKELGLFAMTISAHKVGGPIGVGALILQKGIDITPILHGGGQERDIRSGTLNAAGIIAFVAATQSAMRDLESNAVRFLRFVKNSLLQSRQRFPTLLLMVCLRAQRFRVSQIFLFPILKVMLSCCSLMQKESRARLGRRVAQEFKKRAMS